MINFANVMLLLEFCRLKRGRKIKRPLGKKHLVDYYQKWGLRPLCGKVSMCSLGVYLS